MTKNYSRVLFFTDCHFPYHHKDTFKFLLAVKKKFKPEYVVCGGDSIDNSKISFHEQNPDSPFSPSEELEKSIEVFSNLFDIFKEIDFVDSNHSSLFYRRQKYAGLPRALFKDYKEILNAPKGYNWHEELIFKSGNKNIVVRHSGSKNDVLYAQRRGMCFLQGHFHSKFSLNYWNNGLDVFWTVTGGCLIDAKSIAFEYGKTFSEKPMLGVTMIIDGVPQLIPMKLTKSGRWNNEI